MTIKEAKAQEIFGIPYDKLSLPDRKQVRDAIKHKTFNPFEGVEADTTD